MKFKKKLKTRWHQQRIKDKFFHDAKKLGYRSRSTFKLLEINKKFRILKKGQNVLDLNGKVDIKKSNGFLTPLKDSTFELKHSLTKEKNG